jgi:hypothetical protein
MDRLFFIRRKNLLHKKRVGVATLADLLELERSSATLNEYMYLMKQQRYRASNNRLTINE